MPKYLMSNYKTNYGFTKSETSEKKYAHQQPR